MKTYFTAHQFNVQMVSWNHVAPVEDTEVNIPVFDFWAVFSLVKDSSRLLEEDQLQMGP